MLARREYDRPRPDVLQQLRQFYPNLVGIEVLPRKEEQGSEAGALRSAVRRGADLYELFSGFYQRMTPDTLSELQSRRLAEHLKAER